MADQIWGGNEATIVAIGTSGFFVPSDQTWEGNTATILVKATGGSFSQGGVAIGVTPPPTILDEFQATVVRVATWVDIYEQDGTTPFALDVPLIDGTVSVDMSRAERRNLEFTFADDDGSIGYGPDGFWYDKVIKPYRGIVQANGSTWVTQLGSYLPDNISRPDFPRAVQASCRDFTKKLQLSKFDFTSNFATSYNIGDAIQAIATNGGITDFDFEPVSESIAVDTTFERGTERWTAMSELATSIGYELFFNAQGALRLRPYPDPVNDPATHAFKTGINGNLVSYTLLTSDAFLYNDVIVYGDGTENALVYGRATNDEVTSPTRVAELGQRLYMFPSQHVGTDEQAAAVAQSMLNVMALEQYDVSLGTMVFPWLEAGDVVEFINPDAAPADPTKFMLSNFNIPLGLGQMSATAKRVSLVGS